MAYELLLIDADNTLFDFDMARDKALEKLYEKYNIPNTPENIKIYNDSNKRAWDMLEKGEIDREALQTQRFSEIIKVCSELNLDPENLNEDFVEFLGEGSYLYDGAYEVCSELNGKKTIVIATNGMERSQTPRLMKSDIFPFIDFVAISEAIGYNKPDNNFFEYCREISGIDDKKKMIMIGDSLTADIQGAIDYGIDACWYNPKGLDVPEDMDIKYVIKDLREILDIV